MRILDQYLHPLFLDHDCIVVPGLGGFVCNRQPAQYDEGRQELTPPYRSVLFNERLVHHDGVLAQAVSRAQGITFDQAVKAIELEVAQLKTDITGGSTVAIERVGRLYKGRNERVQFLADEEMERMLRSFGLRNIPLRPIAEATAETAHSSTREREGDSDAFATCFGAIGAHCRGVGRAGPRWTGNVRCR